MLLHALKALSMTLPPAAGSARSNTQLGNFLFTAVLRCRDSHSFLSVQVGDANYIDFVVRHAEEMQRRLGVVFTVFDHTTTPPSQPFTSAPAFLRAPPLCSFDLIKQSERPLRTLMRRPDMQPSPVVFVPSVRYLNRRREPRSSSR